MRMRMKTIPVDVPRTRRRHNLRVLTSLPAGKIVPVAAVPILRGDAATVTLQLAVQMQQTVQVLMNGIDVVVQAWLVPNLAHDRFRTQDDLDLSWAGEPRVPGEPVVPYIERDEGGTHGENEILMRLGRHYKPTDLINLSYQEVYNAIVNYRRRNVSPKLELRDRLDHSLAQAFWYRNQFQHIVPDFDQALQEGEVALSLSEARMPVRGIGVGTAASQTQADQNVKTTVSASEVFDAHYRTSSHDVYLQADPAAPGLLDVYAELQANGIKVSLANIKLAEQTQAWARLRTQYNQLPEEYLIDHLMDGLNIVEQGLKYPILLHADHTQIGMSKRYASDGASLTESVVDGATNMAMRFATPRIDCGGVIMVTMEIMPEQLFERQEDPWLHCPDADSLPHYLRDELDPQKIMVVPNRHIDVDHDQPNDTFGYAPNHYKWNQFGPAIGGRFYRPEVDAPFDEDRQYIWAVETQNPQLTTDFYLVPEDIHLKPFHTSTIDPFDVVGRGEAGITGLTVFGPALIESTNDYEKVMARVDQSRIVKPDEEEEEA